MMRSAAPSFPVASWSLCHSTDQLPTAQTERRCLQGLPELEHCQYFRAHGVYVHIQDSTALILQVFALGFVSVFDQVLEGLPDGDRENLFKAYLSSLDEDPSKYRQVLFSCQPQLSDKSAREILSASLGLADMQRRKPLDSCLGVPWMMGPLVSTASFCMDL